MTDEKAVVLHRWILLDQEIEIPLDRAAAIVETVTPHVRAMEPVLARLSPEAEIASFISVLRSLKPHDEH